MGTRSTYFLLSVGLSVLLTPATSTTSRGETPAPPFEWPEEPSPETTRREKDEIAKEAFAALRAGDVATVERLLEAHPDIATAEDVIWGGEHASLWLMGPTLLHLAIQDKHYGLAERLIEAGANVTRRDHHGLTPLYYAAVPGAENLVKRLLAAGAEPNARHPTYGTPLHKAMEHADCDELVSILLAHGADPAAENEAGITPLRMAGLDVALTKRFLQTRIPIRTLDHELISCGLVICRLTEYRRSPYEEPDEYRRYENQLVNCRETVDALREKRPAGIASPWWRVCTQQGPYRMTRGLPLPPAEIHPLHVAVWNRQGKPHLVCIVYHGTTGLGTQYWVAVFDKDMRLVRTGRLGAWHAKKPFALVEVRVSSSDLPPSLRNRWVLAVLVLDPFGTFDQRLPVAVSARGRSERPRANVLSAEIVDWHDGPTHGMGSGSGYYPEGEMDVRWAESGPSLLAGPREFQGHP